jgi:hypothetical protein
MSCYVAVPQFLLQLLCRRRHKFPRPLVPARAGTPPPSDRLASR